MLVIHLQIILRRPIFFEGSQKRTGFLSEKLLKIYSNLISHGISATRDHSQFELGQEKPCIALPTRSLLLVLRYCM